MSKILESIPKIFCKFQKFNFRFLKILKLFIKIISENKRKKYPKYGGKNCKNWLFLKLPKKSGFF